MTTVKKVSIACSLIVIIAIGGFGIYEWFTNQVVHASTIFYLFLGIGLFFHSITWGEMDGKHEGNKDELEKHITLKSSKVSYYLLLVLMIIVLAVSERVTEMNDIKNLPLVTVIGLAWITMPITEYVISRKYR